MRGCIVMPESLIEEFELFYIELPSNVRRDLSFMMVALSNEDFVFHDPTEVHELAAHKLFNSATRFGVIGDLIYAVSILDVYFAMSVRDRFGTDGTHLRRKRHSSGAANVLSDFYSTEIEAILMAKRQWLELRATRFAPHAIAAALAPTRPMRRRSRPAVSTSSAT
jgi:hypothetical protein